MDLKKTSFDVGMHFGNFLVYSLKIGNFKKSDASRNTPGAFRPRSSADGMHPAFSGRHPKLF